MTEQWLCEFAGSQSTHGDMEWYCSISVDFLHEDADNNGL